MTTTILIVDDGALNRKLLRAELESAGYRVIEATQGLEALSLLELDPHPVGLIIADLLMPDMDGFQLSSAVRQRTALASIPVLVYTATYDSPSDEKLALDAGADAYLLKPAPSEQLLATVKKLLSEPQYRRPRSRSPMEEHGLMKQYNAVLVAKLEDRSRDLQTANEELLASNRELQVLRDQLEIRVQQRTAELESSNRQLTEALDQIQKLASLLPICSYCRKIRNQKEYWMSVEAFLQTHLDARFSHSVCPDCMENHVAPQLEQLRQRANQQRREPI